MLEVCPNCGDADCLADDYSRQRGHFALTAREIESGRDCERRAKERAQAKLAKALAVIEDVRKACEQQPIIRHRTATCGMADVDYCPCEDEQVAANRRSADIAALLPPKESP